MVKGQRMAHWKEIRDARYVEQFRSLSYVRADLIERFEATGDIIDLHNLIQFPRLCKSQKKSSAICDALPKAADYRDVAPLPFRIPPSLLPFRSPCNSNH